MIQSTLSSQLVVDSSLASSKKLRIESPKSSEAGKLAIYNATHSQLYGVSNDTLFFIEVRRCYTNAIANAALSNQHASTICTVL